MGEKMQNERLLRVETAEGALEGDYEEGVFVFRGIPYAAPPVGPLRWQPPKPTEPWHSARAATRWGCASWQNREFCEEAGGGDPGTFSEDCLYLNVWTPDPETSRPLPVMVWLHGGGFTLGSGGLPLYSGHALAARGAVVVTINYRLGHLGFFAHPALDEEYTEGGVVNNFALLDQIAALQWVQRNIAAFGGNRSNVTLFGESAGARSVLSLFCSPLASGLFHKGIAQSAYALPDVTREDALKKGVAVARRLGLENASAAQLRALPADAFWPLEPALSVGPAAIAGDSVLPEPILSVLRGGRQQPLPLMIGSNSDEASVLTYFGGDPARVITQVRKTQRFGLRLKLIRLLYDGIYDDSELGRQVARDMTFTTMGYVAARAQHRCGMPVWRYWFDYVAENARDLQPDGAWHGSEIAYVFNTLDKLPAPMAGGPVTESDRDFARQMSEYWLNFARDVSPFSHQLNGEIVWPAWRPYEDRVMRFGEGSQPVLKLEDRFMRRRTQLFRLLMGRMVRL